MSPAPLPQSGDGSGSHPTCTLFPFPILGIDTDNGGEFLNEVIVAYCEQEHITFTRGRPYQKRDQCNALAKKWSDCAPGRWLRSLRWRTRLSATHRTLSSIAPVCQLFSTLDETSVEAASKEKSALRLRFVSNTPSAPIRIFSVECCIAGKVLAERSVRDPPAVVHTLYQEQERRKRLLGWRRTKTRPL
jgi:hypothetical protein